MKKITKMISVVIVMLLVVSLAACGNSKKDNTATNSAQNTESTTTAQNTDDTTTATASDSDAQKAIVGTWEYQGGGFTYTFNEDGTGVYDVSGTLMNLTYTITDTKISIAFDGSSSMELDYQLSGDKLNIKDSLGEDTIYIRK